IVRNDPITDNPDSAPVVEAEDDLPTSPNLAAEEFVDIQIDTLSELAPPTTPTPAPTPTSTPTPTAEQNSIDNLANALAPQTNPAGSAAPTATPAPAPANTMPPLPEITPDPNYNEFYLVVVNEGNATALARIQDRNPEAYFEQIAGARRIQVGAYDSLAIAQEVVDRLKAQGLPAQVYRP
ncbi:MAG: SPOR domain-containing protein, partial [Coleofasciculaceae cyanobacterium RL_1_1]|nr:SPOR domain-containing protein [Coleofasciculaceae cyanobacterium RL_1_1]